MKIILLIFTTVNDSPNLAHRLLVAFSDLEKPRHKNFSGKTERGRACQHRAKKPYGLLRPTTDHHSLWLNSPLTQSHSCLQISSKWTIFRNSSLFRYSFPNNQSLLTSTTTTTTRLSPYIHLPSIPEHSGSLQHNYFGSSTPNTWPKSMFQKVSWYDSRKFMYASQHD